MNNFVKFGNSENFSLSHSLVITYNFYYGLAMTDLYGKPVNLTTTGRYYCLIVSNELERMRSGGTIL